MKKVLLILIMCVSSLVMFGSGEHFTADRTGCESFSLKIHSVLCIDGVIQGTSESFGDALELVAYDQQGVIRGAKRPLWNPKIYMMYYLQTIYGYNGAQYTFKVYDNNSGQFLAVEFQNVTLNGEIIDPIEWVGNGVIGGATDPNNVAHINFTTTYELEIAAHNGNAGGYHLIASPVTEEITPSGNNGFVSGNFDLYYFDQKGDDEGKEWINYNPNQFNIESTKGYLYASESGTTLKFAGTAYNDDGVVPLEYFTTNPSTAMHGWNLIGNPFPNEASVDHDYYVMNEGGTELIAGSGPIAAMNGLFVKATEEGQSVTFTPNPSNGSDGMIILNMLRDRGAAIDRAIVRLNGNSTLPKFMLNPNNTKIYIEQDGDDYAVVSSTANELPVSFKASRNGTYTLNVAVENAEMGYLHLIDHIAGTDTDLLTNPSYTFEANTNDYASRFTLVMVTSVGLEEHFAFYNGHNWSISNNGEALLQVVDVMGRVLNSKEISGDVEININQPAGVYMFRLINGNDVKVQKVIIK